MSRLTAALPILVLAIWLARSTIATYGGWYYHRALHRRTSPSAEARICVIIPVRGVSVHLPSLCEALSAQHYPRWRVVFAVESAADPAKPARIRSLYRRWIFFAVCLTTVCPNVT